jgi:hypothetical protein
MRRHFLPIAVANLDVLHVEMQTALSSKYVGLGTGTPGIFADLSDDSNPTDETTADTVALAHNPASLSANQTLKAQLRADAQAVVGLNWADLTNPQLKLLVGVLLYKIGAINPDLTIAPLNQWDV